MILLVRPIPYSDESLESYLLRLCLDNCYSQFGALVAAIVIAYPKLNNVFEGSLPLDLGSINVCFSNHISDKRYKALIELANLVGMESTLIQDLIVFRSQQELSSKHQAVIRKGVVIPRLFLRKKGIPVCIDCLRSEKYIRQVWHYIPYQVCHIHKKTMIRKCPNCGSAIDFKASFSISICHCGFDLIDDYEPIELNDDSLQISSLVAGDTEKITIFKNKTLSQKFGALLWWYLEKNKSNHIEDVNFDGFVEYFSEWPSSLSVDLALKFDQAGIQTVTSPNNRKFSDVFGQLLISSFRLPSSNFRENFILLEIVNWIHVALTSSNSPLISLLKLNLIEASILLNTTTQQVARLIEFGALKTTVRLKSNQSISVYSPVLRLCDVFEQWVCSFQTEHSNLNQFLSKW